MAAINHPINRKIIHVDMDAFFAAIEQRDFPEYAGKPLIVGGDPESRGVVATCSYEARKFGIHSAMSSARAYRLCPQAIFVRPRFSAYQTASQQMRAIFEQYTDLIEPLSLDEAYLDVSSSTLHNGSATLIAQEIRAAITKVTSLTASAGVSYNKMLAKIASDMDKPDGLYVITPDKGADFVASLPIGRFFGIGKKTEAKMESYQIYTGDDLRHWKKSALTQVFGKMGGFYYDMARGIDHRPVENQRERKSIGSETTFEQDLSDFNEMLDCLVQLLEEVIVILKKKQLLAQTVTLKVKYHNFQTVTRSFTLRSSFQTVKEVSAIIPILLTRTEVTQRKVRLLGISVSKLTPQDEAKRYIQMDLFDT